MVTQRALRLTEVAQRLSVHPDTILSLIRRGELPGFKVGGRWRVPVEALERLCRPRRRAEGMPQGDEPE